MATRFAKVSEEEVTILVNEGVPQKNQLQGGDFVRG